MGKSDPIHSIKASFLSKGEHHFRHLKGVEELGQPFQYDVTFYSSESGLDPDKVLGELVTVSVKRNQQTRYFNGYVTDFAYVGTYGGYYVYQVELRPWFWLLTQQHDCLIFQEKSTVEIFEDVAKTRFKFTDFKKKFTGSYSKYDYRTQYRESSFDFLSRLLEKDGITYFFEHEDGKHTMVLSDDSFDAIEGTSKLPYRPPGEAIVGQEHVSRMQSNYRLRTSKTQLDDFDFTKPKANLTAKSQISVKHKNGKFERYDYPGKYSMASDGEKYAKKLIEEIRWQHKSTRAFGNALGLAVGGTFDLEEHPDKKLNAGYLITRAEYEIESGEIEQMGNAENRFEVTMNVLDDKVPFRTPQNTPKPVVGGPQTAIVVGKSGEEIWTDKYGRVKVQFHWDREGKKNENSSCWIRVSQGWAGKNWGMIHIPRIGQEVIVDFLEGDPDRPIITGRVYNEDQKVPYTLPANQTKSGILSRSTKDGKAETFNELRFEDKKGEEEVYFHAEKDFNRVVENNDTLKVGFDKHEDGNQKVEVYNNQDISVGTSDAKDGSQTVEIQKNQNLTVKKGNRSSTINEGNDTLTIKKGKRTSTIQSDDTLEIKAGDRTSTIKTGNDTLKVPVGKITIQAGTEITLKVGASKITVKPAEISLSAPQIKIKGTAKAEMSAPMAAVKGSGMAQIQGALVKIN